ncbi:MAG: hypothetical protein AB1635_21370 [Acidobacteriota bacterium]
MQEGLLERTAGAQVAKQVGHRGAAGFVEQAARGDGAEGVGGARILRGEAVEGGVRREDAGDAPPARQLFIGPAVRVALERRGQPFAEPCGYAAGRDGSDEGVGELVGQHPLELLRVGERARCGHPDPAVEHPDHPGWRPRDVAERFAAVEHDRHGLGRMDAQRVGDAPVGALERLERRGRERLVLGPFEGDREEVTDGEPHPRVQVGLALPPLEGVARLLVRRPLGDHGLVLADGAVQVARALQHLSERGARNGEARIEPQRLAERGHGVRIPPLPRGGDACAQMQGGMRGIEANALAECRRGRVEFSGGQQLKARLLEQGRLGTALPRRRHRHHQHDDNDQRGNERGHASHEYTGAPSSSSTPRASATRVMALK